MEGHERDHVRQGPTLQPSDTPGQLCQHLGEVHQKITIREGRVSLRA